MNTLIRLNEFEYMDRKTINLYLDFFETPLDRTIRKKIWNDVLKIKEKKMKKSFWKSMSDFLFGKGD